MAAKYRTAKDLIHPISDSQWDIFALIHEFLEPFKTITNLLSGAKYTTLSSVVPLFNLLFDRLDKAILKYREKNSKGRMNATRNSTLHLAATQAKVIYLVLIGSRAINSNAL